MLDSSVRVLCFSCRIVRLRSWKTYNRKFCFIQLVPSSVLDTLAKKSCLDFCYCLPSNPSTTCSGLNPRLCCMRSCLTLILRHSCPNACVLTLLKCGLSGNLGCTLPCCSLGDAAARRGCCAQCKATGDWMQHRSDEVCYAQLKLKRSELHVSLPLRSSTARSSEEFWTKILWPSMACNLDNGQIHCQHVNAPCDVQHCEFTCPYKGILQDRLKIQNVVLCSVLFIHTIARSFRFLSLSMPKRLIIILAFTSYMPLRTQATRHSYSLIFYVFGIASLLVCVSCYLCLNSIYFVHPRILFGGCSFFAYSIHRWISHT